MYTDSGQQSFLGQGWKFPVEFRKSLGTVVMLDDEEDIRNSLDVLFRTSAGERIMHSNYGSELQSFLFAPINRSTLTYMQAVISDEILFNEARIILENVFIQPSAEEPGRLDITVEYTVASTNNRYNYVYPFYMKEATNLKF